MAKQVEVDLPQLVGFLGELAEIRLPIYQTSSAVFANEVREDSIEYGEPALQRILLMPLADPALVTSDGLALPLDPIRAIIMGESPPERSMVTVKREIDRHFYVLRRESLTKTPPITHQLYLVPIDLEEGLLEGENFVERDVVQNESGDDSLASILANDNDGTTGSSSS
jgi:hypothetical protein